MFPFSNIILYLGMNHISHEISIPQIPPLTNKSIVTIHAFISLKSIYIKMPFDESNINKFLKDFSVFCLTCMYIYYLIIFF